MLIGPAMGTSASLLDTTQATWCKDLGWRNRAHSASVLLLGHFQPMFIADSMTEGTLVGSGVRSHFKRMWALLGGIMVTIPKSAYASMIGQNNDKPPNTPLDLVTHTQRRSRRTRQIYILT